MTVDFSLPDHSWYNVEYIGIPFHYKVFKIGILVLYYGLTNIFHRNFLCDLQHNHL